MNEEDEEKKCECQTTFGSEFGSGLGCAVTILAAGAAIGFVLLILDGWKP